jgi:anti-anti-sigma factor
MTAPAAVPTAPRTGGDQVMSGDSRLLVQGIGDVTIVNFIDASILDMAHIQKVADELYSLVDEKDRRKIVLDFSAVRFLSSQMLGVLLTLQKKLQALKGKMAFCGIKPELKKVFQITALDKLFEFYPDETKALNAF